MSQSSSSHGLKKLFIAALLSQRADLDDPQRGSIIAAFPEFNTYDPIEIRSALENIRQNKGWERIFHPRALNWPSSRQIEKALTQAREWFDRAVFVMAAEELGLSSKAEITFSPVFFAWGSRQILNLPRAAVLNSRKPRFVSPQDRWIKVTKWLVQLALDQGCGLVTSWGNYPYELVCSLAKIAGCPTLIICDSLLPFMLSQEKMNSFLARYDRMFPPGQTLFLSPFSPGRLPPRKLRGIQRDACLVILSSSILAAEIRSGGNMERLIREALKQEADAKVFRPDEFDRATAGNKTLLSLGAQACRLPLAPIQTDLKEEKIVARDGVTIQTDLKDNTYLIHFTRSCPGPWPGQPLDEYYRSLLEMKKEAAHTAFDTLNRILKEQRIRGSGHLIRGRMPVVSLTAQSLKDLKSLIRWRRGLVRWAFEPYGIAMARALLVELGARPVIYGGEEDWQRLPHDRKYRFQLHQPPDTDWSLEKEWRLPQDLNLKDIPEEHIRIILPSTHEAMLIASAFSYQVVLAEGFKEASKKGRP
ncbi:MAG: hypothetical protein JRI95_00245 [Deltaproteobacteria bacterium]|nr:hypothetical protein [Deltaproteobacteria bacterium]MBW2084741.1 hypothetical protein [Deltaproteobacteria bacterium]